MQETANNNHNGENNDSIEKTKQQTYHTCKKMKRNTIRKKSEKIDRYGKRKGKNDSERNK